MQVVYLPADQRHALLYPLTRMIPTYFCANWLTHLILMPQLVLTYIVLRVIISKTGLSQVAHLKQLKCLNVIFK